jgi:alcohol dehydrogenase YqhD (iron-dependent ADH family)
MKHVLSDRTVDRFVKYGVNVFGVDPSLPKFEIAEQAIERTYAFFEEIGIPMHLRDVGIDESRIDEMARHVAENEGLENAWVPLFEADIAKILRDSL